MTSSVAVLLAIPAVRQALELLNGEGEEARVVGGAVRNALLGRPVHEYDIATTATPDKVMARARQARLRSIPTGIAHGTVTVVVQGMPFEVTTLREDVETDGRHAVIHFGRDFADDAQRRDFTINALSMGLDGVVHDYTGGLADIVARRVRFIGDPGQRIREDFLRVLRFFRFSAEYAEGPLDPEGLAAAIRERAGLAILSRERIRQELLKLLVARRASEVLEVASGCGILGPLLKGVAQPARLDRLISVTSHADALLRLAAIGVQIVEDAERLRDALRLSNQEAARLTAAAKALVTHHGLDTPPSQGDLRAMLLQSERQAACDGLLLAHAESRSNADDPAWRSALRFLQDTPTPNLPFSGADLIARGFSGRALGEALKRLQANWIRAGFPQDSLALAALLDEAASKRGSQGS